MAELKDHERAHNGQPGMKVRHGADSTNRFLSQRVASMRGEATGYQAEQKNLKSVPMRNMRDFDKL